jgi:hypothetical protein
MKRSASAVLCLACLVIFATTMARGASQSSHQPSTKPAGSKRAAGPTAANPSGAPHDASMLADTAVLARIENRVVRVHDFNERFFDSDPQERPTQDSLGRVEFLNSLVNKNVLGLAVLAANHELSFEDRTVLREHTQRVLSNVLYQRMVIDSVGVTEADIQAAYEQFKTDVHLKHILFPDRTSAERVRKDLVARRVAWSIAVRKFSIAPDREQDGDMGWRSRLGVDGRLAAMVFGLPINQVSDVVEDNLGYHLVVVSERRPALAPALEPMRNMIRDQLVGVRASDRTREIQKRLLSRLDVVFDDKNIDWTATRFVTPVSMQNQSGGPVLEVNANLPELTALDLERVLAHYKGGQIALDQLVHSYDAIPAMLRPAMNTPAGVKEQVEAVILEPTMLQLAYERGLDKDPVALQLIDEKREQLMVERMFQDSVQTKVRVTDAMRRKYYDDNKAGFFTFPRIRFAALSSHSRAGADSLKARLLAGEKADAILLADSLQGLPKRGSIQERFQNEHGPYQKVLFEELRPGQVTTDGPDKVGDYVVLQLIAFEQGRQLPFAQVERLIDESVQNIQGDSLFKELIARQKKRYRIEAHPEWVMRFRLAPPS